MSKPSSTANHGALESGKPAGRIPASRGAGLILIVLTVMVLAAIGSHLVVSWLGIRSGWGDHRVAGSEFAGPLANVAGSSLLGDALDVPLACRTLQQGMQTWFVAGSSPCEWVELQSRAADAKLTIIGISAYDLNEHFLCDYRPEIVPLTQTIQDLVKSESSWAFGKRVVSQYPLTRLRLLFPTLGRSAGVTGGIRDHFERYFRPGAKVETEAGPTAAAWSSTETDPTRLEKISNWSPAYMLRRLSKLRSACQGLHSYDGPKRLALQKMLAQGRRQGEVVVLVLPVSPAYQREFLDAETRWKFEETIADHQRAVPGVRWLRVDQVPELNTNDVFWDAVHMNTYGKKISTDHILAWMKAKPAQP